MKSQCKRQETNIRKLSFKGVCNHVYIHTLSQKHSMLHVHTHIYNHLSIKNLFKKNQTLTTMYYKLLHLQWDFFAAASLRPCFKPCKTTCNAIRKLIFRTELARFAQCHECSESSNYLLGNILCGSHSCTRRSTCCLKPHHPPTCQD